jgi:hypothetical protein
VTILYSEHNSPSYIRPPTLGSDQVICGPEYPDHAAGGRVESLKTAHGEYDIGEVAARLPAQQRPTLLVVRGDNTARNVPRNLGALKCRKVLVVGDTHHHPAPIRRLLRYAEAEPFDAIIFDYTRQHAHYFVEAGLRPVYWLPGFNIGRVHLPERIQQDIPMSFVGSTGNRHPRRLALLRALKQVGLPLQVMRVPGSQARMIYARSRVNLNCSLNGDLNLRIFEILASGGMLLTDRLGPQAGLDLLFDEGRHLATYDSVAECIALGRSLLADQALTARTAAAGHAQYEATLSPERIRSDFFAIIQSGRTRPELEVGRDPRSRREAPADRAQLLTRIAQYEIIQELHRQIESLSVASMPGVDARLLADILDLPRLRLTVDVGGEPGRERAIREELARCGMEGRCELIRGDAEPGRQGRNIVLATMADWRVGRPSRAMDPGGKGALFITDLLREPMAKAELEAEGFRQFGPNLPLFSRQMPDMRQTS